MKGARQMTANAAAATAQVVAAGVGAGAAAAPGDWHQIDWDAAYRNVRRLQARIVKAHQAGRWGKVQALQRLLTHSFSGKALAVRRVTENQGKKTPGVDRVTWDSPAQKATAIHAPEQRGYQPRPLRRVHIPKRNGATRPLGIPTMQDRAMQALYLLALDPIAECTADPNSYGFRTKRSTADAIGQCFVTLSQASSAPWILEGDIRACFDRISHDWILAHVPMERSILRKWLTAGYMEKNALYPTEEGTPQGGISTPVVANMALDGLERMLAERFPSSKRHNPKVHMIRYADDFCVTGASKELLEREVNPLVEQFMGERGLELSPEKTLITHIESGFDCLGQHVRKYRHGPQTTLLITPSAKNGKAFLTNVRDVIQGNKQARAGNLIRQLNSLIVGWARYHQHVVSSETFTSVDHAIMQMLWRWANRRHPNKGKKWVKGKYFPSTGTREWVFSGHQPGKHGLPVPIRLAQAADTKIVRHQQVRGAANPYDPAWEVYFEARLGVQMSHSLLGRRTLLRLWHEQQGCCPVCNQPITKLTGWHSHHLVWRSKGGSDNATNRVLLHPSCHSTVHSHGLTVVKPRPAEAGR
jgi:RNA-directed DNA polymerase